MSWPGRAAQAIPCAAEIAHQFVRPLSFARIVRTLGGIPSAREELRHLTATTRQYAPVVAEPVVEPGDPACEIVRLVEREHVGLIVVTARGSGAACASPIGCVAREVLLAAHVPLVVLPEALISGEQAPARAAHLAVEPHGAAQIHGDFVPHLI